MTNRRAQAIPCSLFLAQTHSQCRKLRKSFCALERLRRSCGASERTAFDAVKDRSEPEYAEREREAMGRW